MTIDPMFDIFLALILGSLLGLERTVAHKPAGVRTFGLISMGACLFVILAQTIAPSSVYGSPGQLYVLQGLIVGIGFVGGGTIFRLYENKQERTSGLTTAAGMWIAAGMGGAIGYGLIKLAVFVTFLTLLVFTLFWFFEKKVVEEQRILDGQ